MEQTAAKEAEQAGSGCQGQQNPEKTVHYASSFLFEFPLSGSSDHLVQSGGEPGQGEDAHGNQAAQGFEAFAGMASTGSAVTGAAARATSTDACRGSSAGSIVSSGSTGR